MKNKQKNGQAIVEVCLFGLFYLATITLTLCCFFYAATVQLLKIEVYSLARSQLYGTPRSCKASQHWPKIQGLKISFQCSPETSVKGKVELSRYFIIYDQVFLTKKVGLQ